MAHESLADKTLSMLAILQEVEKLLADTNDFADPTGYCNEHMDIVENSHTFIGTLRRRTMTLKRRFERNQVTPNTKHEGPGGSLPGPA